MRFTLPLFVVLAYVILAIVLTLPMAATLGSSVVGEGGDPWQTMWRFESKAELLTHPSEALSEGGSLAEEFLGTGEPRLVNLSVWPWMPLQILFGQPVTYNLAWLISFALSGWAMYLLVYSLTRHRIGAFLAGLAYMMLPYHFAHSLGHFGAMQLQWLPLGILFLRRFVENRRLWDGVLLALVVSVQAWTEHHYALWFLLFSAMYLLYERGQAAQLLSAHRWRTGIVAGLLLVLVVLPYWPTIRLSSQGDSLLNLGVVQSIRFSADLLSYFIPSAWHPLWGPGAEHLFRQHFTGNSAEATHYVGWVVLLLVIFFRHKVPSREYGFWLSVALVFLVISLGPRLHIMGRVLPIPLPYALLDDWPVFSSVRAVGRAGVMVALALCVLFGRVIATQVRRPWVGAVIGCLVMLDFLWIGVPRQPYGISPAYAAVSNLGGARIIEVPASTNYAIASRALYMSGYHGKEVLGTIALERAQDGEHLNEIRSMPALRQVSFMHTGQIRLDRPDFFDQALPESLAETMAWFDVGGIVVHRDSLSALQLAALHNFLEADVGLASQEFDDVAVYEVNDEVRQRGDGIFLTRDSRWQNVAQDEAGGHVFAEIPAEVGFSLYNVTDTDKEVRLTFDIAAKSNGNMLFIGEGVEQAIAARGGESVSVTVNIPAKAKRSYIFRNQLTEKIIIQDPKLSTGSTSAKATADKPAQ